MATKSLCSVPTCGNPAHSRGWCHAHYRRWRKTGDVQASTPLSTRPGEARRWLEEAVLYKGKDCLIWPFSRGSQGYAQIGTHHRPQGAHRIICELAHGPSPIDGLFALHSCGNGHLGCVNPMHLRWGTQSENALDAVKHGVMPVGMSHHNVKLTDAAVQEIRRLANYRTQSSIAKEFGVAQSTVGKIVRRKRWCHVTDDL